MASGSHIDPLPSALDATKGSSYFRNEHIRW
jgi:hypothetical protein